MIRRGSIYQVNLNPAKGRRQAGARPVLVVSADAINNQPLVVSVVAGTEAVNVPRDYPTNVRVTAKETGMRKDTVFLCFQLRSLDCARFRDASGSAVPCGVMPSGRMAEVDAALRRVLGLDCPPEDAG